MVAIPVAGATVPDRSSTEHGAAAAAAKSEPAPRDIAVERALAVMPESIGRMVIVPNLSATARTLNEFLAGMNRAQLLLGADPVDQLMGLLGFSRHVDRFGSVMIGWVEAPAGDVDDGSADAPDANRPATTPMPRIIAAVPSQDPDAFLTTNFAAGEQPGTVVDAGGRVLHARVTEHHILLSASSMDDLSAMGPARAAARRAAWPASTAEMIRGDDIVLVGLPRGLTGSESPILRAVDRVRRSGALAGPGAAVLETMSGVVGTAFDPDDGPLANQAEQISMSVRFDPLALILRGAMSWREPVAGRAEGDRGDRGEPDALQLLPPDPGMIQVGWDRSDAVARDSIDRLMATFGTTVVDGWSGVEAAGLRLPNHDGGFPGGLLAGTTMVARGPGAADRARTAGPWLTMPGWALVTTKAAEELPGEWTLRRVPTPDGASPGGTMVMLGLAGPRGLGGAVAPGPGDGAGSTMVARARDPRDGPDALVAAERMLAAAPGYADDPIADLMVTMMARRPNLAAFVDVAQVSQWVARASREQPLLGRIDPIRGEQPPVGIGVAGAAAGVDGTVIIPATLAVIAFDAAAADGLELLSQLTGAPDSADGTGGAEAPAPSGPRIP